MSQAEIETTTTIETGLRLPDGTTVWPPQEWHHRPLATGDDRTAILGALVEAAKNLGYPRDDFLSQYSWVERTKTVQVITSYSEGRDLYALFVDPEPEDDSGG